MKENDDGAEAPAVEGPPFEPAAGEDNYHPDGFGVHGLIGESSSVLSTMLSMRTSLGEYARSAFCLSTPRAAAPSYGIWPIPPQKLDARVPAAHRRGGRRRRSSGLCRKIASQVNGMIVALSYLALGLPAVCPPSGRLGSPCSPEQSPVMNLCRGMIAAWNSGPDPVDTQFPKLDLLLEACTRMRSLPVGSSEPPFLALASSGFTLASFKKTDADFDAPRFLTPLSAACLLEPRLLRPPADALPSPKPGLFQHGSVAGLRRVLDQWDRHHRLALFPPSEVPAAERGELFEVPKDGSSTRVVFNRIPANSREVHLPGAAALTPSGHALVDIDLGPTDVLTIYSEDLSDYYPAFKGTRARAATNVIGKVFSTQQFSGTRALADLEKHCSLRGVPVPKKVVAANLGLVMGDLNACDIAVEAHLSLLRESGGLPFEDLVLNRRPLPRGRCLQGVVIDDRFLLTIGARDDHALHRHALSCMDRGRTAYADAGLRPAEHKARRGDTRGTVVGAELDGELGTCGAEVARRKRLCQVSLDLATHPRVNGHAARALVATWNHALLFRRPMLCLLGSAYADLPALAEDAKVYDLPLSTREEFTLLAALAPMMRSDLRTSAACDWYSTDASTHGLGATRARLPPKVTSELYRRRNRKAAPTSLYSSDAAEFYAEGELDAEDLCSPEQLDSFGLHDCRNPFLGAPSFSLVEYFDFLEVCCGKTSPLIDSAIAGGLRAGPRIDLAFHTYWNLESQRVVSWIFYLLRRRRIKHFHSGVPCTTFSIARKPALRGKLHPWGFDPKGARTTAQGNFLLQVTLLCLLIVARTPGLSGSHEHPDSALSWKIPQWDRLSALADCQMIRFAMCSFGTVNKKMTRLFGVKSAFLLPLGRPCRGGHAHVPLEGSLTTAASEYPKAFCDQFIALLSDDLSMREDVSDFGSADLDDTLPRRGPESIYINDLAQSLQWRPVFSRRARASAHINLKEMQSLASLLAQIRTKHQMQRFIVLVDSLVVLGACAKGRSPSRPLNHLLRQMLPDILGYSLYPGFHFLPTRLISADAPSRFREIPGPRGEPPYWFEDLADGSTICLTKLRSFLANSRPLPNG